MNYANHMKFNVPDGKYFDWKENRKTAQDVVDGLTDAEALLLHDMIGDSEIKEDSTIETQKGKGLSQALIVYNVRDKKPWLIPGTLFSFHTFYGKTEFYNISDYPVSDMGAIASLLGYREAIAFFDYVVDKGYFTRGKITEAEYRSGVEFKERFNLGGVDRKVQSPLVSILFSLEKEIREMDYGVLFPTEKAETLRKPLEERAGIALRYDGPVPGFSIPPLMDAVSYSHMTLLHEDWKYLGMGFRNSAFFPSSGAWIEKNRAYVAGNEDCCEILLETRKKGRYIEKRDPSETKPRYVALSDRSITACMITREDFLGSDKYAILFPLEVHGMGSAEYGSDLFANPYIYDEYEIHKTAGIAYVLMRDGHAWDAWRVSEPEGKAGEGRLLGTRMSREDALAAALEDSLHREAQAGGGLARDPADLSGKEC